MNRPHSHRNLLWSGHWPVVFHKQTGTLLYSLFVSWLFYYKVTEEWMALQCVLYRMLTEFLLPIMESKHPIKYTL